MNRSITTIILSATVAVVMLWGAAATADATETRGAPSLKIGGRADTSVYLQSLDIDVEVAGGVASTRYTMVFRNRTFRELEGELTFPLPDGAAITRHALDVQGRMREAVPVERTKATRVFEEIQQRIQVIDPSVLERVDGNNFRVRIYPFPAGGTRTVSITYEEELPLVNGMLQYNLPMAYTSALEKFSLKATVSNAARRPVAPRSKDGAADAIRFEKVNNDYTASLARENYRPPGVLSFALPASANVPQVILQRKENAECGMRNAERKSKSKPYTNNGVDVDVNSAFRIPHSALNNNGGNYFLASVAPNMRARRKRWGDELAIIWDVSLSGSRRDMKREIEALDIIFASKRNARVNLYHLNNRFNRVVNKNSANGDYRVVNGNWNELKMALETAVFDGGTDFSRIDLSSIIGSEILFFSDGLSTLSDAVLEMRNSECGMRNESQNIKTRNNRGVGVDVDVDVNSAFRIPNSALKSRPIHTIISSPMADYGAMRLIAGKTGGKFVNINAMTPEQLRNELLNETPQFLGIQHGNNVREVYPTIATPIRGNFSISGIIDSGNAELTLLFGNGHRVEKRVRVKLRNAECGMRNAERKSKSRPRPSANNDVDVDVDVHSAFRIPHSALNISRIWARKKIAELDLDYEKHSAELAELGARFGIVTRNTTLMVLEDVEDYARYGIEPPASEPELLAEYRRLKKEREEAEREEMLPDEEASEGENDWARKERRRAIENSRDRDMLKDAIAAADSIRAWRDTEFDTTPPKPPPPPESPRLSPALLSDAIPMPPPRQTAKTASRVVEKSDDGKPVYAGDTLRETLDDPIIETRCDILGIDDCWESHSLGYLSGGYGSGFGGGGGHAGTLSIKQPTIKIKAFKKDAEYLDALTGRAAEDYQIYLRLRNDYSNLPEFYFDMAGHFHKLGANETALRVLTSISELEISNAELYRLMNYRLGEYGEYALQKNVCRKLIRWRPFEPQNHRDYALALAANGEHQAALDSLYAVFTKIYSGNIRRRNAGIHEVIIMEMNRLIAKHPGLDVSRIDKRLLMKIPVDIRVVVNWNKDNTNIGLRVVDPYGEECYNWKRNTRIGGRMSNPMAGYGPEQFILRNAVKGKYRVFVNHIGAREFTFEGPAIVMAEIYIKYADRTEQRRTVSLQVARARTVNWRDDNFIEVAEIEL